MVLIGSLCARVVVLGGSIAFLIMGEAFVDKLLLSLESCVTRSKLGHSCCFLNGETY